MSYWANRAARTQERLTEKSVKDTEKQLRKYYGSTLKKTLDNFEQTYNKLLLNVEEGREPTPADLYRLDRYWQLQNQLRQELQKLGDEQTALLSKVFMAQFQSVYEGIALPGVDSFTTLDAAAALQMINEIWCADGKTWSQRIWDNTARLQETLNEGLIHCVVTGKKPTELKKILQERFNVSYSRADALVRTEMSHIQTQAAKKRYEDYGLKEYEILGNDDDSCGNHSVDCHKMNGKRFSYAEMQVGVNAPPFHPRCKCCITPVID